MKYNAEELMRRAKSNISRAVGNDVSNKYHYVLNSDDLTNAYLQMRNDLGYPLMIDSKYRRAIVYNKEGLENKISAMIAESMASSAAELSNMIATDAVNDITEQLNSLVQTPNGTLKVTKTGSSNKKSTAAKFTAALTKSLVKAFFKLLDDITDTKTTKRRR